MFLFPLLSNTMLFNSINFFFLFLVNCSHKLEYIKLKKWLKERGFEDNNLRPAEFWGNALFIY